MIDINRDYELIFNNIDGFFVIDKNERIVVMCDSLAQAQGYQCGGDVIGKPIREVLTTGVDNLFRVMQTGKPQLSEIYFDEGDVKIRNCYPVYKDGELAGVLEYDAFESAPYLHDFLAKIHDVSTELSFYKNEYEKRKGQRYSISDIIGESEAIKNLRAWILNVAKSNSTVLIQGETGTGKELVAHAIHNSGRRGFGNLIKINCATIPEALFESELFGYEEGSFTGAKKGGKRGKAELANGGTIFFDEIDSLPLPQQSKLLRFLQEKEITRVGGGISIPIDVRVIAATNKDLKALVTEGKFREDLYYRLDVIETLVPPLRERKEDFPLLVKSLLKKICEDMGRYNHEIIIKDSVVEMLSSYDWPGNVRELRNALQRLVVEYPEGELEVQEIEKLMGAIIPFDHFMHSDYMSLEEIRSNAERDAIIRILKLCKNNRMKAAKVMKMSRQTLYEKIEKYNIIIE